jgi:hypothetical protein
MSWPAIKTLDGFYLADSRKCKAQERCRQEQMLTISEVEISWPEADSLTPLVEISSVII